MLPALSIHQCNICKKTTTCHALTRGVRRMSLLQDIANCKFHEMLVSGKNSTTYICRNCAVAIRECAYTIRNKLLVDNSINNPTIVTCKCQICQNANEPDYTYRTELNTTMRLVLFKLTNRNHSKNPGVIYFCKPCYRLLMQMTALLYKFSNRKLFKKI